MLVRCFEKMGPSKVELCVWACGCGVWVGAGMRWDSDVVCGPSVVSDQTRCSDPMAIIGHNALILSTIIRHVSRSLKRSRPRG